MFSMLVRTQTQPKATSAEDCASGEARAWSCSWELAAFRCSCLSKLRSAPARRFGRPAERLSSWPQSRSQHFQKVLCGAQRNKEVTPRFLKWILMKRYGFAISIEQLAWHYRWNISKLDGILREVAEVLPCIVQFLRTELKYSSRMWEQGKPAGPRLVSFCGWSAADVRITLTCDTKDLSPK